MPEADRIRWNERWRERGADPGEPSLLLTSLADLIPTRGRALDAGSSAGRHAPPSARFLLEDGEIARVVPPGLAVVRIDEGALNKRRHEARLVVRRS